MLDRFTNIIFNKITFPNQQIYFGYRALVHVDSSLFIKYEVLVQIFFIQ